MHLAVTFTDSITLGSAIMAAFAAMALVVGIIYGTRYKVGYEAASAAATELRASLADERDRVVRLDDALTAAAAQLTTARDQIARLESLPNLAEIVALLDRHEVRAQERHEATVEVLSALVARIERNSEGG